jgi:hypothetical protein
MLAPRAKLWPAAPSLVDEALDLLGVSSGDVVGDFGSGDGVALFAAAALGARAIGWEIVADRAEASRVEADARGISDRVQVITGNALDADASIVNGLSKVYLFLIQRGLRLVAPLLLQAASKRPNGVLHVVTVLYKFDADVKGVRLVETRRATDTARTPLFLYAVENETATGA